MNKKLKVEKIAKNKEKSPEKKIKSGFFENAGQLMVDVFQTDKEFIVKAPIAGIDPSDIEVFIDNEMLVIKGHREESEQEQGKNYFYQECFWGAFERKVILPEDIDSNKMKAALEKGILTVRAPRVKQIKKKKLEVEDLDE